MNPRAPRQALLSTMCSPFEIALRVLLSLLFLLNGGLSATVVHNALQLKQLICIKHYKPSCVFLMPFFSAYLLRYNLLMFY